ncbi:MAG: hypothetical protein ACI81V_000512 [Lentimonas sp.]|jgi:uncharacterized protein (DUF2062 family)
MTAEESKLKESKFRHIRRVKWWLRPLPRRANIHRYPILKFFARSSRKRMYLWSFRVEHAVPAIYAGCILTLMPLYGVQILLALLFAILLRANLAILVSLQVISNPITIFPIWFTAYQIGRLFLGVVGIEALPLNRSELYAMLDHFITGQWSSNLDRLFSVFGVTSLGAIIMGTCFGLIASFVYRFIAKRTVASYSRILKKLKDHKARKAALN